MSETDVTGAFFLIDGNSLAYRAFYALPETISTSAGLPTNALYGFAAMLVKVITDFRPAGVIVAWDAGKKVFRHDDFEDYKAHRKPMPDNLSRQFGHFDELVTAFGFESLKKQGYEADDILATLVRDARSQAERVVVVTADRDALQLVGGDVYVMTNTKGISEVKIYDETAVEERFGVSPGRIPDFIGLKGDASDNIPGVPGIGDKTAAALLAQYGTLQNLFDHMSELKGKKRELLEKHRDRALLSRELAVLNDEVPLAAEAGRLRPGRPDRDRLRQVLAQLEFNTLLRRLEEIGMLEAPADTARLCLRRVEFPEIAAALAEPAPASIAWDHRGGEVRITCFAGGDAVLLASGKKADAAALGGAPRRQGARLFGHDFKSLLALLPGTGLRCSHDTAVAAYLLNPAAKTYKPDQLAAAAGIRLEVDGGRPGEVTLARYAAQVFYLARWQQRQLQEKRLQGLFASVEMPLVDILAEMENTGVRIDLDRLGDLAAKVSGQIGKLGGEIRSLTGADFNVDSPQQLAAVLFEKLKLPPAKKTKKGYSTDASVLKNLRGLHPVVGKLETYRELAKLYGTYLQALPQMADAGGRIHTTFNQTVTATGRLSSSNPNLQNIPIRTALGERIRDCFTAAPGRLLIAADYSQVELRIMAHLSGEDKLSRAFAAGEDVHRDTAVEVFGVSPAEVTPAQRSRAKAVNFGIMYGISAFGLSEQLGISQEEAAGYIEAYLARFPQVAELRTRIIEQGLRDGYVCTMLGRRRPVPELAASDGRLRSLGERLAVNTVIQGSAADIMKVAMINCHKALAGEQPSALLVLQVHDELVFEAPAAAVEAVAGLARREMCGAWILEPPLEVDVGIGETWLAAKNASH